MFLITYSFFLIHLLSALLIPAMENKKEMTIIIRKINFQRSINFSEEFGEKNKAVDIISQGTTIIVTMKEKMNLTVNDQIQIIKNETIMYYRIVAIQENTDLQDDLQTTIFAENIGKLE